MAAIAGRRRPACERKWLRAQTYNAQRYKHMSALRYTSPCMSALHERPALYVPMSAVRYIRTHERPALHTHAHERPALYIHMHMSALRYIHMSALRLRLQFERLALV